MSLIALTDRVHTGRSMARTLLLLVAVTGAIIVGLLAMHSLNTHTATDTSHQTVPRQVFGRISSLSKLGMVGSARPRCTSIGRFQAIAS